MRRLIMLAGWALCAASCSLLFDGNDLRGKGGGSDGGGLDSGSADLSGPPPSVCGSDGGMGATTLKFAAPVAYGTGTTPVTLAAGDLDGDQKLDLVVNNDYTGSVTVLFGDGAGGFGTNVEIPFDSGGNGTNTRAMALGDLNKDGHVDVVAVGVDKVATAYRGVYFLGPIARAGVLPTIKTFPAGADPSGVGLGDVDGDGKVDVVTGNGGSLGDDTISVYLGDGAGNFAAKKDYCDNPAGCPSNTILPGSILIGDFTGDGKPDVVTGNFNDSKIHLLIGAAGATLFPPTGLKGFQIPHVPTQVRMVDLNHDGKLDLVAASDFGDEIVVLYNTGNPAQPFPSTSGAINGGMFGDADMGATTTGPTALAVADVDSDGNLDIVTANAEGHNVTIFLGKPDGSFMLVPQPLAGGPLPGADIVVADFNGDCRPDIAVMSVASNGGIGAVHVLLNQSN